MNRFGRVFKPRMWLIGLLLAAFVVGCGDDDDDDVVSPPTDTPTDATAPGAGTGVDGLGAGPAPVELGAAGDFVILAESQITNVPTSAVTGDVGLSPATGASIGLTCAEVTGTIYSVDAAGPLPCVITNDTWLTQAIGDKGLAYTDANSRAPDYIELGAGDIGGLNLGPATYKWDTGVQIPTDVTLTGGPNDVWIFQIAQGLTVASGAKILLAGGALPQNIYWATFDAADMGTTSVFNGVIMSQTSIGMATGASINGRMLAGTAVTLDQNEVVQPAP